MWCSDGWLVAYSAERDPLQTHSQVNIYNNDKFATSNNIFIIKSACDM